MMDRQNCVERLKEWQRDNGLKTMTETYCRVPVHDGEQVWEAIASTLFPGLVLAKVPPDGPGDIGDDWYSVTLAATGLAIPPGAMRLADAFSLAIKLVAFVDWTTVADVRDIPDQCQEFCRTYSKLLDACRDFCLQDAGE